MRIRIPWGYSTLILGGGGSLKQLVATIETRILHFLFVFFLWGRGGWVGGTSFS